MIRPFAVLVAATAVACGPIQRPEAAHPTRPSSGPARASSGSARPEPTPPSSAASPGPVSALPSAAALALEEPLDTPFGPAAPFTFVAAAPDRRWVAVCKTHDGPTGERAATVEVGAQGELRGARLEGFFLDAVGPGFGMDAFAGSDPSGRFVAFVQKDRLFLRDTTTRVDTELGPDADVRDDSSSFVHPRVVAFDPTGRRLLYLKKQGDAASIVVRELATGTEITILPGDGDLYRADFDASGDWVVARVVVTDTNGDGRLEWPVRTVDKPWMRCAGPLPRYAAWERPGDEPEFRAARASGGKMVAAPGLVTPFGDSFVERDPDATLVRADPDGKRVPIADKACASHLLHVDGPRGVLLVTCLDKKSRPEVLLVSKTGPKRLGILLSIAAGDRFTERAPRLVALHPGNAAVLVDLERQETEPLAVGDRIVTTEGSRALVLRGRNLVLHDYFGGAERTVAGEVAPFGRVVEQGGVVVVPPFVVDVARGEFLGSVAGVPLAVSADGAVLLPTHPADATHLAVGPLEWKAPLPADAAPVTR